jgi:hypothetical protein
MHRRKEKETGLGADWIHMAQVGTNGRNLGSWPIVPGSSDSEDDCGEADEM